MTSLRDVAEKAGVSVATASRVASGSASVRPATRERVERAMRELLYVPPAGETTSGAIGLLLPEFENPVFAAFAQAMETHARTAGFATILCNTAGEPLREVDYVHMLLERRVDGMIFISAEITDVRGEHSHYRKLLERGARLVFVNGGAESLDVTSVGVDERAAGRIATEHLIELGHERIGFVAGEAYASRRGRRRPAGQTASKRRDCGPTTWSRTARSASPAAAARSASCWRPEGRPPDGGDLLERPDGDRRDAGGRGPRPRRPRRPLGRRVRRHRRRDVDAMRRLTTVEQPVEEIAETAIAALSTRSRRRSRPVRATSFGLASGPAAPRLRLRSTEPAWRRRSGR